ncbi:MAG: nucleotidyltransferase domain-containing protein [Candidatus Hadarchaeales archaeon]
MGKRSGGVNPASPKADRREVIYPPKRWELLKGLRERALEVMEALSRRGMEALAHGSLARGDVEEDSDIDLFLPQPFPSYLVETALLETGLAPERRELVMATPWQLPKAHLHLDERTVVTFPLLKPRPLELEFYHFGGALEREGLGRGERVPGVDKRLMLIEPTPSGHVESPVRGREGEVAKRLGVSLEIVRERVQVLTARKEEGHTGLFLRRELSPSESFEEVFDSLARSHSFLRLRLKPGKPR